MSKDKEATSNSRRNFLKMASVSAPAAAVALSASEAAAVEIEQTEGLQDTAHTRAYFDSTRF